jgi:hypothetical protein
MCSRQRHGQRRRWAISATISVGEHSRQHSRRVGGTHNASRRTASTGAGAGTGTVGSFGPGPRGGWRRADPRRPGGGRRHPGGLRLPRPTPSIAIQIRHQHYGHAKAVLVTGQLEYAGVQTTVSAVAAGVRSPRGPAAQVSEAPHQTLHALCAHTPACTHSTRNKHGKHHAQSTGRCPHAPSGMRRQQPQGSSAGQAGARGRPLPSARGCLQQRGAFTRTCSQSAWRRRAARSRWRFISASLWRTKNGDRSS